MENNRKGSGIFLGVVSVATLIVAIIGATFAFFSSTAQSGEEAVGATAYEFDVTVTDVSMVSPSEMTGIIPLQAEKEITPTGQDPTTNLLYALNTGGKNGVCTDSNGYQVCAIYKVTLNNGSTTNTETLNLAVKTTRNVSSEGKDSATVTEDDTRTHFTDLTFQALTVAAGTFALNGALVTLAEAEGTSKDVNGVTIEAAPGTTEHYFVVYLAETDDNDDQSEQMGADFAGQLVYTTAVGGNTLTGTFTFEDEPGNEEA